MTALKSISCGKRVTRCKRRVAHASRPEGSSLGPKPFRDLSWVERWKTLGDPAEQAFVAVAPTTPLGAAERYGIGRPEIPTWNLPDFVRGSPDMFTESGCLVECVGLGLDGVLKLKTAKLSVLAEWATKAPLWVFVFNSHSREWLLIEFPELEALCDQIAASMEKLPTFDSVKEYVPTPWNALVPLATERGRA